MKIEKNNGFTLIELLVSIVIMTTVISIGYKIIDKSTKVVKEQGNINRGQLIINNMNTYLTKDLEKSKSIKLALNGEEIVDTNLTLEEAENKNISNILDVGNNKVMKEIEGLRKNKSIKYKYIINGVNDTWEYTIELTKNDSNLKYYSISRVDNKGVKIDFVDNCIIKKDGMPITISGNGIYKVNLGYSMNNGDFNEYEFNVSSRLDSNFNKVRNKE